jgi:DegV family protein with EDD domain
MKKDRVIIVTDTTSCVPAELAASLDIEIVPVVFIFGKEAFRDGIDMTTTQFYQKLSQVTELPTTSGGLTAAFLEAFLRAGNKAGHILCINLSVKLSTMANSARIAKDLLKEQMPQVSVDVIDCGTAAGAQGLIVLAAARAAGAGKSLPEIIELVKQLMPQAYMVAMLDTLKYLAKGGRAPRAAALATSILKIKPLIEVKGGIAQPVENVLTTSTAMKRMLKYVEARYQSHAPLHLVAMHACAQANGEKLLSMAVEHFKPVESALWEFTPVMGVHTGPGLVALAFYTEP